MKMEPSGSNDKSAEQISSDAMDLFVKKFGKFIRKNQEGSYQKLCYKKDHMLILMLAITVKKSDILLSTAPNQKRVKIAQMRRAKALMIQKQSSGEIRKYLKISMRLL